MNGSVSESWYTDAHEYKILNCMKMAPGYCFRFCIGFCMNNAAAVESKRKQTIQNLSDKKYIG